MVNHSKRYLQAAAKVDRERIYDLKEALALIKSLPAPKFDESIEVAIHLGVDPKKSDQLVRGAVSLPKGLGKTVRVVVFADGDKAKAAKEAGADEVGAAELADKIMGGWLDFDVVITSPDMMKHVGKLGKVLGPQGKMPSPKSGTVTPDVAAAVKEFKAGKVEFRTDAGGNVQAALGKRSFSVDDLQANVQTFLEHVSNMRPPAVKGEFFRKICVSSSMGPGVLVRWEVVHA
ncbi:MAG: 50S ribosomal protein L1 [Planctomycetes bacterium]|nr:50S ribosomal protein L1 [Planctomycetota bacterium]